jgi:hypothetical protein
MFLGFTGPGTNVFSMYAGVEKTFSRWPVTPFGATGYTIDGHAPEATRNPVWTRDGPSGNSAQTDPLRICRGPW